MKSYIDKGVQEGAKLVFGGKAIPRPGFYLEPTVFADVKDDMTIAREEIFGPVQSIIRFSDLKDALARANNTEFGLAAGVFTKDIGKALTLASELEAGIVWVNTYGILTPQTVSSLSHSFSFGPDLLSHLSPPHTHCNAVFWRIQAERYRSREWRGRAEGIPRSQDGGGAAVPPLRPLGARCSLLPLFMV